MNRVANWFLCLAIFAFAMAGLSIVVGVLAIVLWNG